MNIQRKFTFAVHLFILKRFDSTFTFFPYTLSHHASLCLLPVSVVCFSFSTSGHSSSLSTCFLCFLLLASASLCCRCCEAEIGLPPLLFITISQCFFHLPIKPQLPLLYGPGVWATVGCFTICASPSVSLHSCIHLPTAPLCTPSSPPSLSLCLHH